MFMPTAILDLDYDCLPQAVQDLERYNAAQVLVRVGKKPAGLGPRARRKWAGDR